MLRFNSSMLRQQTCCYPWHTVDASLAHTLDATLTFVPCRGNRSVATTAHTLDATLAQSLDATLTYVPCYGSISVATFAHALDATLLPLEASSGGQCFHREFNLTRTSRMLVAESQS
jgi:hypothetical protein